MPSKGGISVAEFVKDLRHGMTSSELMTKYSLVPRELDGILRYEFLIPNRLRCNRRDDTLFSRSK